MNFSSYIQSCNFLLHVLVNRVDMSVRKISLHYHSICHLLCSKKFKINNFCVFLNKILKQNMKCCVINCETQSKNEISGVSIHK